ncbi:MAG: DNA translocase FtsK [Verrucomicrobiales bacterium]|nr:DNA translocase FtsK [Verrucomicrobiales bacterium]
MATKTAKKKTAARRKVDSKPSWISIVGTQEISALVFGGIAVLLLLAFISYSPNDLPSWVPFGSGSGVNPDEVNNFVGPIGALIAGYGYFFFGAACYLIPAVLFWWAVQVLATKRFLHSRNYFAFTLFTLSAACLIEYQTLLFQDWVSLYNLPKSAGGFFGHLVGREFLARYMGAGGSLVLVSILYLVTLIIITGIHPFRFLGLLRNRFVHYWKKIVFVEDRPAKSRSRSSRKPQKARRESVEDQRARAIPIEAKALPAPVDPTPSPDRVRKIIDASQSKPRGTGAAPEPRRPIAGKPQFENYVIPSLDILNYADHSDTEETDKRALIQLQNIIVATLQSFQVDVEPGDITKGPTITRYEVYPAPGLRVNKIIALKADLARATRAERINILAPIPGRDTVGIEIANSSKITVALRELFEDDAFQKSTAKLPLVLGKDVYGKTIVGDLAKMPHLLVAGATGSGKSVCINSIIASLLYRFTPDELKFIMIDPKVVEMQLYNDLPHMVVPVVTEPKKVLLALRWVINEMERRYSLFAKKGTRNFEGYNLLRAAEIKADADAIDAALQPELAGVDDIPQEVPTDEENEFPESLPYIVVIIDELADLMQTAPADVETGIARIAQKARAAGIHLIVATQTPRADVVTGIIKANIPSRIAFQVSSKTDSRIILDENGAENLVGKGDMLYLPPGSAQLIRAQGALITDEEAQDLVEACAVQGKPNFETGDGDETGFEFSDESNDDSLTDADEELIKKCLEVVYAEKKASTSLLQRRLRLGYTRAARMIDILESRGFIGPGDGAKPREILIDLSSE